MFTDGLITQGPIQSPPWRPDQAKNPVGIHQAIFKPTCIKMISKRSLAYFRIFLIIRNQTTWAEILYDFNAPSNIHLHMVSLDFFFWQ